MVNPIAKIKSWMGAEGSYKTTGYGITSFGNWFPIGFGDGFERDINLQTGGGVETNTTVEACVKTISETIAMLPMKHIRVEEDGEQVEVKNSAASRVLRKPNPFQTKSEFIVDLIRSTLLTGNGYGVCTRNKRFEIDAIYPQTNLQPYTSLDQCDVFYQGFTDELRCFSMDHMLPSRDVLHFKLYTNKHPLIGVTSLSAAYPSAATGNAIQGQTNRFFSNMSRPSGVLSTDMTLKPEQTKALRERFEEQARDKDAGGLPILTNGLKYQQITMSAVDSEIIDTYNMTVTDIARVFRVPPSLIGVMDKATFANVESLMKFWINTGLGFIIEHLENRLDALFDLPPNEHIECDTAFLLQADFKSRIDGLKSGVQGGIYTVNEVRKIEGLKILEGKAFNTPMMQLQMVPVGLTADKLEAEIDLLDVEVDEAKNPEEPQDMSDAEVADMVDEDMSNKL